MDPMISSIATGYAAQSVYAPRTQEVSRETESSGIDAEACQSYMNNAADHVDMLRYPEHLPDLEALASAGQGSEGPLHMQMTIDPSNLKTPEEKKAYEEYCALQKTIEEKSRALEALDNRPGTDAFADKGKVAVNNYKAGGLTNTGSLIYNPANGEASEMWLQSDGQVPSTDGVYDTHKSYEYRDNGQTRTISQEGCGAHLDGAGHVIDMDRVKERFVYNRETGTISCAIDRE